MFLDEVLKDETRKDVRFSMPYERKSVLIPRITALLADAPVYLGLHDSKERDRGKKGGKS
jgi:IMP cyclohydrolase